MGRAFKTGVKKMISFHSRFFLWSQNLRIELFSVNTAHTASSGDVKFFH